MSNYFSKKGDTGKTDLINGERESKDDPIFELLGSIDQLNAHIGLAISLTDHAELKKALHLNQITLSKIMGIIAGAKKTDLEGLDLNYEIIRLEKMIINFGKNIDPPKDFTFSGKTLDGAVLNICRTEARKTERRAVANFRINSNFDKKIIAYFNRLSTVFYVYSLFIDQIRNKN